MMMSITAITAVIMVITVIRIRMRTELTVVLIITVPLQIFVSGVCGASGQPAQTHAVVESGSATDGPLPLRQDPTVRANRHRARAATQDSAQVQLSLSLKLTRYLHTVKKFIAKIFLACQWGLPIMKRMLKKKGSGLIHLCLSLYF